MTTTCALAMIVRNEEANLPACLESVRGFFDELVIVDTGSSDSTVKIARSFGARVFRFDWCDDFSAARNFGLGRVKSDYFFRLDADDRLHAGSRKRLQRLLDRLSADRPESYTCEVWSRWADGRETRVPEFRVFPAKCRFVGRIHERVRIEDYAPWLAIGPSDVRLDHSGYSDADEFTQKMLRNLAIIRQDAAGPNPEPMTWLDLARTEAGLGLDRLAIEHAERFLSVADRRLYDCARQTAFRQLIGSHESLGDAKAAIRSAERCMAEFPNQYVSLRWVADELRKGGHLALAAEGYQRALAAYDARGFESTAGVDASLRSGLVRSLAETRAALALAATHTTGDQL